jgi:hypothetical protein
MQEKYEQFNNDDYLLSCANGVINLKTGELLIKKGPTLSFLPISARNFALIVIQLIL